MSFSRPNPVPRVPTPPRGDEVAAFDTYLEAQQAVDYLSDNKFAVEHVTIVGTDLKMVERVTGRLSYGRVAIAGALSGAWFGFFVGLLLSLFGGGASGVMFAGIAIGAGFGLLFSILSYALTGGRRDFTSSSQIVASTYAILCETERAGDARAMLLKSPNGLGKARRGAATAAAAAAPASPYGSADVQATPVAPPAPRPPDPRWTTPSGAPRYGAMRPTTDAPSGGDDPDSQEPDAQGAGAAQPKPAQPDPAQPEPEQPDPAQPEPEQPSAPESQRPQQPEDPYRPPQP